MDSLSQIVLGAAVGEAVLGKKIGNRAIVIGATGGTIPDLDVIANAFLSPMQAMEFHRGISHSFTFSIVAPLLFGGITHLIYKNQLHTSKIFRASISILLTLLFAIVLGSAAYAAITTQTWWGLGISIALLLFIAYRAFRYVKKEPQEFDVSFWQWYSFFFLTFITHVLLDVFTTYGTQILMPFSNYRASLSSVAVVDPLYTMPFLLFVIIASMIARESKFRRVINYLGIIISTGYLGLAYFNKTFANVVFEDSYKAHRIEYKRYMSTPTLFNSFLWSSVAEADSVYYLGAYSKFDPIERVNNFKIIPKNHHHLKGHENDEHIQILKRFSDNYFTIQQDSISKELTFIDLRWGALSNVSDIDEKNEFPFVFRLEKKDGQLMAKEHRNPPSDISKEVLESYWDRIMGRWQQ